MDENRFWSLYNSIVETEKFKTLETRMIESGQIKSINTQYTSGAYVWNYEFDSMKSYLKWELSHIKGAWVDYSRAAEFFNFEQSRRFS